MQAYPPDQRNVSPTERAPYGTACRPGAHVGGVREATHRGDGFWERQTICNTCEQVRSTERFYTKRETF
jgi:hypothetical protein